MVGQPKDMTILEQVLCMVYLAETCTLKELRQRQDLIEQQFKMAHEKKVNNIDGVLSNLSAMQDNLAAAVAYQTFKNDDFWLAFIRQ